MTKRVRLVLFLSCAFLFFLAAPLVVLYSQGYRFDFETKKLTQTGGLFLKAAPKQADIFLDGKFAKRTDFFFGSTLIENLLPKKYKVKIEKEGYYPWEKTLEVKEKEVTEAKNVVLFQARPSFGILTGEVKDWWFSPDGKKIILKEINGEGFALKLYDIDKNLKSHLIEEKEVSPKTPASLLNLEWSQDSREVYLDLGIKEQEKNFVLKLDKIPPILMERKIDKNPENILASSNGYYLDNRGFLFKSGESKVNQNPLPIQPETEYKLSVFDDFIFLEEGESLYLFNKETGFFEKLFEEVKNLKISTDKKKIVIFTNSELWIFFLRDASDQPSKKAGEKLFLLRLSERIGDVFWLNPDFLIFSAGEKIKIAETDERDKIQTWEIGSYSNPQIFFNQTDKKLYILSEGNLYLSENLLKF